MKKLVIIFNLLLPGFTGFCNDFSDFIDNFPIETLPYNTRQFHEMPKDWNKKYKRKPSNLGLKYFCNNDTNKFKYDWEVYSQDENKLTGSGRDELHYYAFARFEIKDCIALIYYMTSPNSDSNDNGFYLAIYTKTGKQLCNLWIDYKIGFTECVSYMFSRIDKTLKVEQFKYELNFSKLDSAGKVIKLDESCDQSILYYFEYQLSSKMAFVKIKQEKYSGKFDVCSYQSGEKEDDFARIKYNAR